MRQPDDCRRAEPSLPRPREGSFSGCSPFEQRHGPVVGASPGASCRDPPYRKIPGKGPTVLSAHGAKADAPKLIEIESASAVANVTRYYESYDVPKGTLRGAPPIPADDLTSLRVSFFLVANKSVDADTITDLTQSLVDVRTDLLSQYPLLAQVGAPRYRRRCADSDPSGSGDLLQWRSTEFLGQV